MKKINVAIVGLGFGAEFIPIYQCHPHANCYAICQRDSKKMSNFTKQFGVANTFTSFEELLKDKSIDAVHINTPIADHGWMSIEALKAGKHVACTVPMSINVEECKRIVELSNEKNLNYMMMETAVYTREFLFVKEMLTTGKLGEIQFLRGSHQQNMGLPGWPEYWYGFPPMYYATHAISPLAMLLGKNIKSVRCFGSGKISPDYTKRYKAPFAIETAHLSFHDTNVKAEVTRSLFNTIRQYRESFDVYGTKASFEWAQLENENPVIFTGYENAEREKITDSLSSLPQEIRKFGTQGEILDENHVSFIQGAGHGGSHPHLIHQFVNAILNKEQPDVNAINAANWTAAGILSHQSAMQAGKEIEVPIF